MGKRMTWGDIKLIALQTMFSNDGETLVEDDVNREYLNAMPGKANEALQQIALVGRPILKSWQIEVTEDDTEDADGGESAESGEKLRLTVKSGELYKVALSYYLPRFRCLHQLLLEDGVDYAPAEEWRLEGDDVLVIPADTVGTYTVWYKAYPQVIDRETEDSEEIDLAPEAAALIPLYIAAELYKEDELSLATVLRNEYEDGLVKLQTAYASSGAGIRPAGMLNTTGWW